MKNVKVMVIAGEGINCETETAQAFRMAGAEATIVYIQEWMNNPKLILDYQILAFPGGFSYGDELHSGQILALDLKYSVANELKEFIHKKGLILGVCNGFQILMKLGVFENQTQERTMTLFHNDSFKFMDRWVKCSVPESKCVWTKGLKELSLPVRHGEGRIVLKGDEEFQKSLYQNLVTSKQVALTYHEDINGSYARIAGLTDPTGQVLGLMPHPEAALEAALHPEGYQQNPHLPLTLFKNAVQFAQENI
jgi:phosphoribosylformylglycinamidine synthase I